MLECLPPLGVCVVAMFKLQNIYNNSENVCEYPAYLIQLEKQISNYINIVFSIKYYIL